MSNYRVTVRYGQPRQQYTVLDIAAESLASALRLAADALPAAVSESADLAEIRVQGDPEEREYTEG